MRENQHSLSPRPTNVSYIDRPQTTVLAQEDRQDKQTSASIGYRQNALDLQHLAACKQLPIISVRKIDTAAWQFVQDILNELNSLRDILQSDSSSAISDLESINKLIIHTEAEQEGVIADIRGLSGRARELMIAELNRLEDDLQKLRAEKDNTLPHAKQAERTKVEVDEFFRWCEQLKGNYEEAIYEEKRRALRRQPHHSDFTEQVKLTRVDYPVDRS